MELTNNTMSSLQIAELTGKPHNDLMKSIRKMESSWSEIAQGNFSLGNYIDKNGQKRPMYQLSKSECLYIATKFNDIARAKLILRWEQLEKEAQKPRELTRLEILDMAQDSERKRIALQKENDKLKPKAELMERVMDTGRLVNIGQVAKILELGFGRNTLYKRLRGLGVFFVDRNEPKQQYVDRGYFVLKEKFIEQNNSPGFVAIIPLVTQKGLEFISKQFQSQQKLFK